MLKPSKNLLAYWCVLISLLLLIAQSAFARPGVRSLEQLSPVRVVVEDLNRATQQLGLQKEQIFSLTAQQLIKDGLTVLKPEVQLPAPIVYVRLSSVIGGADANAPVGLYLTVQVKQFARLANTQGAEATGKSKPHLVTTWEDGTLVLTNPKELAFYTQNLLINLLGDLVYDYRQANTGSAT